MDTTEVFQNFVNDLKSAFSDIITNVEIDTEKTVKQIETDYFPNILKIIQKDETFFTESPRELFGINLTQLWSTAGVSNETKSAIWGHIQTSTIATFMHGDIKERIGTIISTMKTMWAGKDDEISKVLNNENSEGHFKEILEFVMESRLFKIFKDMFEQIDISEFQIDISNPQELMETIKDPNNPLVKKFINKIQNLIKSKLESGQITQTQIQGEIEAIKNKVTSLFGNVFNDMLGGTRSEVPSSVLMGNSPEARRQRMLARLQKKQRDKNSS